MKERPIIFDGESVRAILDGRKTMTRRVIKPQPDLSMLKDPTEAVEWRRCPVLGPTHHPSEWGFYFASAAVGGVPLYGYNCPYGTVGDGLWIKEVWSKDNQPLCLNYEATSHPLAGFTWAPAEHMPRWASRIDLAVTGMRVERLQDISEEDAIAEGVFGGDWLGDPVGEYIKRWDSINAKRGYPWANNDWVWVPEFERVNDGKA